MKVPHDDLAAALGYGTLAPGGRRRNVVSIDGYTPPMSVPGVRPGRQQHRDRRGWGTEAAWVRAPRAARLYARRVLW